MEYTNNSRITTINDVENFATHLVKDCNISFHPDDDFADYINIENQDKIALYNRLNDECFDVCESFVPFNQIRIRFVFKWCKGRQIIN